MTIEEAHRMIKRGDVISLRMQLRAGLDPNLANAFGYTLLMAAALAGNTAIGSLLLEFGADPELQTVRGETALLLAPFGSSKFFNLLLFKGVALGPYPDGRSLESHVEWVEIFYPERMLRIKEAIAAERKRRIERDQTLLDLEV